jgi:hypothetical protein
MPEKKTIERAKEDAREGKAPSTQAGEFVREEMEHIREGKHGARSRKQAIAIGLSKARRAGIPLKGPDGTEPTESNDESTSHETSQKRSRASLEALQREGNPIEREDHHAQSEDRDHLADHPSGAGIATRRPKHAR